MKYIKKAIVVEAEQYTEYGMLVKGMCNSQTCFSRVNNKPHVHTIHDDQTADLEVGDWIIPEEDGAHFYPIKPDTLKLTYDSVEDRELLDQALIRTAVKQGMCQALEMYAWWQNGVQKVGDGHYTLEEAQQQIMDEEESYDKPFIDLACLSCVTSIKKQKEAEQSAGES